MRQPPPGTRGRGARAGEGQPEQTAARPQRTNPQSRGRGCRADGVHSEIPPPRRTGGRGEAAQRGQARTGKRRRRPARAGRGVAGCPLSRWHYIRAGRAQERESLRGETRRNHAPPAACRFASGCAAFRGRIPAGAAQRLRARMGWARAAARPLRVPQQGPERAHSEPCGKQPSGRHSVPGFPASFDLRRAPAPRGGRGVGLCPPGSSRPGRSARCGVPRPRRGEVFASGSSA